MRDSTHSPTHSSLAFHWKWPLSCLLRGERVRSIILSPASSYPLACQSYCPILCTGSNLGCFFFFFFFFFYPPRECDGWISFPLHSGLAWIGSSAYFTNRLLLPVPTSINRPGYPNCFAMYSNISCSSCPLQRSPRPVKKERKKERKNQAFCFLGRSCYLRGAKADLPAWYVVAGRLVLFTKQRGRPSTLFPSVPGASVLFIHAHSELLC